MTIGTPQSFRGGHGLIEWFLVVVIACVAIAAIVIWRSL